MAENREITQIRPRGRSRRFDNPGRAIKILKESRLPRFSPSAPLFLSARIGLQYVFIWASRLSISPMIGLGSLKLGPRTDYRLTGQNTHSILLAGSGGEVFYPNRRISVALGKSNSAKQQRNPPNLRLRANISRPFGTNLLVCAIVGLLGYTIA